MTTETEVRRYQYCSHRDRAGVLAWFDCQTKRFISQRTLIKRTGLTVQHVNDFENGRDGRGYRISSAERTAAEEAAGVLLF